MIDGDPSRAEEDERTLLTASAIAAEVGGHLIGDGSVRVRAAAPIHRAEAHHLSFLASARYASLASGRVIGVLLVTAELSERVHALARVIVDNPRDAMLPALLRLYREPTAPPGIHPTAVVGERVRIGDGTAIGPYAVLGDGAEIGARSRIDAHAVIGPGVIVGEDCHIHATATLYAGTEVGARVRVHAGARLGSDGFGYALGLGARRACRAGPHGLTALSGRREGGQRHGIDRSSGPPEFGCRRWCIADRIPARPPQRGIE